MTCMNTYYLLQENSITEIKRTHPSISFKSIFQDARFSFLNIKKVIQNPTCNVETEIQFQSERVFVVYLFFPELRESRCKIELC